MDLKLISAAVVVFLLTACLEVNPKPQTSYYLSSVFREEELNCGNGNALGVLCTASSGERRCTLKWERCTNTGFQIIISKVRQGRSRCIQFTDPRGIQYALKAVRENQEWKLVFEQHQCRSTSDQAFVFMEMPATNGDGKKRRPRGFVYQPTLVNETMCIGATRDCNENLSLMETDDIRSEKSCTFIRQRQNCFVKAQGSCCEQFIIMGHS